MKKTVFGLLAAVAATLLMFSAPLAAQGGQYQEGLHYFLIEDASVVSSDKVKVEEAFSYLCTHCNTFEPYINSWKARKPENVEFHRIPVVFGRGSWELYARGYATAQMMNAPEQSHSAMMDKLWKEKNIMRSMDELADFYSQFGLEKNKFLSTSRSFAVDSKLRRDQMLVQEYGITGTPSLVVNGKYRITGNAAVPSFEVMLDIVNYLIGIETEAAQKASATVDAAVEESGAESD